MSEWFADSARAHGIGLKESACPHCPRPHPNWEQRFKDRQPDQKHITNVSAQPETVEAVRFAVLNALTQCLHLPLETVGVEEVEEVYGGQANRVG